VVRDTARNKAEEAAAGTPLARRFFRAITPGVIVGFTLLIVLYMFALEPLGFVVSSFLFLVAAMFTLGDRRIGHCVVVSTISLAAIYVVFQTAFSVVLPEGVLRGLFR
jgi:putative tricarboxylic transport membrane protein